MSKFTHLHVHTEFSLLDGLSKIQKLVTQAKIYGMKNIALTDHGAMYGAIKFYKECKEEGINPIIGCEMYIAKRSHKEKDAIEDKEYSHLTVLAQDREGYQNLMKLVTISQLDGFYYRPRVDKEILAEHSKGLMALSGCNSSEIAKAFVQQDFKKAKDLAKTYSQIFGKDNFFLEVQRHDFDKYQKAHQAGSEIYAELSKMHSEEIKIITGSKKLSKETGLKLVATNDIHYVQPQDALAQDAIVCIQTGKNLSDIKRLRMIDSPTFYLKSTDEMAEMFTDIPEAITNTDLVAQRAKIEIELKSVAFPKFEVPNKKDADVYLKELCFERIKSKVPTLNQKITERLEYELSIISKKGYSTYFLVVADFVNWSREKGIISTTRGSASGSLVSYALGITTVDPLYFKLPFERFLNLYRPSLPDIDVDFEDTRRDEVISYVRAKYGQDKVAQIGTFGTMMARAAVRDVSRVLGWPYTKADRVAKMIPLGYQGFHMSIDTAKKQNRDLGNLYNQDTEVKELMDLAEKVEGNARHVSVHAAGVVISPRTLTDFAPLQKETTGEKIITQYDMHDIEETGLVKMDFLGIRNLSILGHAVKIVSKNKNKDINLTKLTFDDKRAFELMAKGETMGLFQLGGSGMTRYLKELKPSSIFDIMAMISLFRPGPMNSIPEFIERKHNSKKIKYFDERMQDYLKESYGVIVYQDDVLLTAINIAGYNWEEADNFRKAMGKKIPAEMAKQKVKFTEGAIKNGMQRQKAEELFKLIEPFAAYGFNKAHAASYAIIAYQTAYMKANFPVEFMTAVMSAEADDPDKISSAVDECSKMGILVLSPDINFSDTGFAIEKIDQKNLGEQEKKKLKYKEEAIRFGFSAIKNVGKAAIEAMLTERDANGPFKTLSDFTKRVNLRVVNRKTMESLIKAGAMDSFGKRSAMLKILEEIKATGTSLSKTVSTGQETLFDSVELEQKSQENISYEHILNNTEEAPREEILSWEREFLGFYLTEHPLAKFTNQLNSLVSLRIGEIDPRIHGGKTFKLGGIISHFRKTITKVRKEEMCFIKLQDTTGSVEIIVFPRSYEKAKDILALDQIVIITGKLESSDESPVLIAEEIKLLEREAQENEEEDEFEDYLNITLPINTDRVLLSKIYEILKSNPGSTTTYLLLPSKENASRKIPVPFTVSRGANLQDELASLGCRIL